MKLISATFIVCMFAAACATPKKTTPRRHSQVMTPEDVLRGGSSFSTAIVILVLSEREVLDEEYKWLSYSYPGYALIRRTQKHRLSKVYDIIYIKTQKGQLREVYFDCTAFWGKH